MAEQTTFIHMVYFWLREPDNTNQAALLAQGCQKHLAGIPGVLRMEVGYPAGTERDVVDNSYGVALLVEFATSAAHDVYQDHPDHLQFIAECSPLWGRVQVFDTHLIAK